MSDIFGSAVTSAKELVLPNGLRPLDLRDRLAGTVANQDYRFTLTSRSNLSVTLSDLTGNADLELYRSTDSTPDLVKITASINLDLSPEVIGTALEAGTYYLRVKTDRTSTSTAIDYALSVVAAPIATGTAKTPPPLFWHNPTNGLVTAWTMTGAENLDIAQVSLLPSVPGTWKISAVVDWDDDGTQDLVWRNIQVGVSVVWFMDGAATIRQAKLLQAVPAGWDIAGVTDWNNDGTQDLVWRNTTGPQSVVWLMDPTNTLVYKEYKILTEVPNNWNITGLADWNNDGTKDLLWRDQITGTNIVWLMGGLENMTILEIKRLPIVPTTWDMVGVMDWNQDGIKDVVWRNTRGGGQNVIWYMGGTDNLSVNEYRLLQAIPIGWTVALGQRTPVNQIPDAIGNTLSTALKLGNVQPATFSDWIGGTDGTDLYEFDVIERTRITLELANVVGDLSGINVRILTSEGNPVAGPSPTPPTQAVPQLLEPGKYYIQVTAKGRSTTYDLKLATFGIENWLTRNIKDAGLLQTLLTVAKDGLIDRKEVITVLQSAGDENLIDATEFADLKTLVNGFYELNNDVSTKKYDYVYNLLNKLVNGDAANAIYKGAALGNLQIGSTLAQLTALIDKWFLGGDRPLTNFAYRAAAGRLFQDGVNYQDINQGELADSPVLAAFASSAVAAADTIKNMFIDNGDGTFTVRFYKPDKTADYVTIDRFLPVDPETDLIIYARQYRSLGNARAFDEPANELWVSLAEKAFVQWLASGWATGTPTVNPVSNPVDSNTEMPIVAPIVAPIVPATDSVTFSNRYSDLTAVGYSETLKALTGRSTTMRLVPSVTAASLLTAVQNSTPVGLVSKSYSKTLPIEIASRQTYTLVGYNATDETFTLFNPWGLLNQFSDPADPKSNRKPGQISLTIEQIIENFEVLYSV